MPATSRSSGAILALSAAAVGDRLPLVNGVYADGSLEAARIARMAAEEGASALLVFPPNSMAMGGQLRPGDGARAFPPHRGRDRPADHPVPVPGLDRARLSVRDAAAARRGGADDPRDQGLVRRPDAARAAHPHAAEPAAAGDGADDPQRLADGARWRMGANGLLSGAGSVVADLQVALFEAVKAKDLAPRAGRSTTGSTRCSRRSTRRPSSTCTTA